ncbi:hypothetical protein L228DRAFT_245413 [Xylona heveae TC161]|uniref:Uncharacterized protein n=1 Tax=Xylona heveae (strain CBS 132557 / TC161) TaxID=1328760 RepID=A0A165I6V9_XYLHT|nr:hypothetical protein L228DRAFT_245413 [Xylona heveae TC161]KZF24474.1 hypothetical protein L228DRAFT_245413 [Xylona heveae TC161]
MSSGASGSDEKISAAKIDPLASTMKQGVPHDQSSRGAVGTDRNIDRSRIAPLAGHAHHHHVAPHADTSGVVGHEHTIASTKIDPLSRTTHTPVPPDTGLDIEDIDSSRIEPMGEVEDDD